MKKHILKHNVHHDAFANQQLPQLVQGYSQGTNHCEPGSEYTKCYPDLKVNPDQRLFPEYRHTHGGRRER